MFAAAAPTPPQHGIPIPKRPTKSWAQLAHSVLFLVVFLTGCIMIHGTQLIFLLPLVLFRSRYPLANRLYEEGIRYTKGAFGSLTTLACQAFAPSTLRVTFETEGAGRFTPDEIERIVVHDAEGHVVKLRMHQKLVIVANHQIYADWWYVWCLTYFMNMHKDVLIVLKKSLKWIPVIGWGMQVFRFIFLARSWAYDRIYLSTQLAKLGRKAQEAQNPFALIIYPEGTLVSDDTRPLSKKYADKLGIPDLTHTLLPRSTGLQYSLRSLAPRLPTLKLLDITVAYPGIPPAAFGQSYYTLRSIFLDRVPPPVIHMHLRLFDMSTAVPIGDLTRSDPRKLPSSTANGHAAREGDLAVEVDIPENERVKFEEWLHVLWREKDAKLDEYHSQGVFSSKSPALDIPLRLRNDWEVLNAFSFFAPAFAGHVCARLVKGGK